MWKSSVSEIMLIKKAMRAGRRTKPDHPVNEFPS
jgi:hypothetical protein